MFNHIWAWWPIWSSDLKPLCSMEQNHWCNFCRRHHEKQFCEIILNLDQWFRRCRLKIFLIWSSGSPFVQWSDTICAILVKGIMRNNALKLFWIWTSGSGKNVIKRHFFSRALTAPLFSAAEPFWSNFGGRHHEEQICEIILNLEQWFRRYCLRIFLIYGALATLLFSGAEPFVQFWYRALWGTILWNYFKIRNHLCNLGEHSCEVIWNLDQWFRRCRLKEKI